MKTDSVKILALVLMVIAGLMIVATPAHAQSMHDATGQYQGLLDLIRTNSNNWAAQLRDYATRLFWLLATIQLVWTFFPLVLKQADFGEIVGELIRFILVIGFFYALLLYSVTWATAVVDSFRTAGGVAGGFGRSLQPGDMFGLAVDMAKTVGDVQTWNPITATMVAIGAAIVLLCFAFIAAFMGVTLIESYIVINASVLFMGFGGSQWTREYAIAMARYAVAVGAKLFVLTLLVGMILRSAHQWQAHYNHDEASMWTMVGLALVSAYLAKQIPDLVQSLITGTSMGGGSAIGGFAAAAAAGAAAGIAAVTTATAAGGAAASGAGGIGGAAGGVGKLAGAINASMSGAGNMARSGTGGIPGSGDGTAASSLSPRMGGGGSVAPRRGDGAVDQGSAASPKTGGTLNPAPGGDGAASQAAPSPEPGSEQPSDGSAGISGESSQSQPGGTGARSPIGASAADGTGSGHQSRRSQGVGLHRTTAAAVRTVGVLSAISVPGMEGAAGLSIGPHPGQFDGAGEASEAPRSDSESSDFVEDGGNIIRPAPATPKPPSKGDKS